MLNAGMTSNLTSGEIDGLVEVIEIEVDLEAIAGRQHEGAIDPFVSGQGRGEGIASVAEALDLLQGCVVMACTNEHQDHEGNRTPENEHPHVR